MRLHRAAHTQNGVYWDRPAGAATRVYAAGGCRRTEAVGTAHDALGTLDNIGRHRVDDRLVLQQRRAGAQRENLCAGERRCSAPTALGERGASQLAAHLARERERLLADGLRVADVAEHNVREGARLALLQCLHMLLHEVRKGTQRTHAPGGTRQRATQAIGRDAGAARAAARAVGTDRTIALITS